MTRMPKVTDNTITDMSADSLVQPAKPRQERIQSFAFVVAVLVCVLLSICFATSSFSALRQSCEIELDSRVNPNDASVGSLVRLPGIGNVRAGAIAAYRRNFTEQQTKRAAFETIDDLQKVKGIGPKTAESVSEYLKFE